jgi:hypothetical protein
MVKEIVQRNLRPILGAQFTEREGAMLMERAFDPKLSEETNIKRIERLGTQVRKMAQAKQEAIDYYEEHGTLAGFKGKIPTIKDIYPETGIREPKTNSTLMQDKNGKQFNIPNNKVEEATDDGLIPVK